MRRLLLIFLVLAAGCAPKPYPVRQEGEDAAGWAGAEAEYSADESAPAADMAVTRVAPRPAMLAPRAKASKKIASSLAPEPSPYAASPKEAPYQAPQAQAPAAKRMVHYSGSATLRSTEPERILDSAVAVVKAAGGYLESRSPGFAALRVPSADFDTLFLRLLRLAEVLNYNQQAEDVTEAVQDTDLRLKVVVSTLERLEALVKKARTEAQKLRLLRELKALREEREVLEARKRDLVQRARFASIQLYVQTHAPGVSADAWSRDIGDFLWIHRLSPFDDRRFKGRATVKFKAPEGMVVSRKRWPWRATSSQGSEFWGSEVEVDLRGDSRFWRESIRSRLEASFKASDTLQAGDFLFCRFKSFGPTPYYYWVGVRSRGGELDLAEFYFPDERQQERLLPGMLAAVERKSR